MTKNLKYTEYARDFPKIQKKKKKKGPIAAFLKCGYRFKKHGYRTISLIAAFFLGCIFKCGLNHVTIGLRGFMAALFKRSRKPEPMATFKTWPKTRTYSRV